MLDLVLPIIGVVCLALVCWAAHLFVSDYEETMSEIRKQKDDDDVVLKWLGDKEVEND